MSEPVETGGRPLASTTNQPEANTIQQPSPTRTQHRKTSQSSDEPLEPSKTTKSRRRPGTTKQASSGPHTGSSRSKQRSTTSPIMMASQLPSVHYTRTGRISKAKKGLKVHNCENCGRSYTRAEHLRRHQKNHAQDGALVCEFPECGKTFYRIDLLQRHQERHNEPGRASRHPSEFSQTGSPEAPPVCVSGYMPSTVMTTAPPPPSYYQPQPVSPMDEPTALTRYTYNPFRTPQIPRTPQARLSVFNPAVRSSPSSTSSPNQPKQRGSYSHRSVPVPVPVDMTPGMSWTESYSQSPGYSSSSGYASPIHGPGDYANLFAHPPYGAGFSRTRTPSNASCEPWSYASRSPTSTSSNMAYPWPSSDKTPTTPCLAYMGTTYPMASIPMSASVDPMAGYGHFGPKTMVQRDEEEGVILFGEQPYGMGPIAHTYPFEQYLDYYWRVFHPTFPVVHRSTFENMIASPMLHAAMIAVGGQYSNDTSIKRKSRILHDRCVKLLERRDQEVAEPDRLCDYQAMFLIEVLSQYRARRGAQVLSSRFDKVYHKASEGFRQSTSQITDIVSSSMQLENATPDRWAHWVELATWQRLLLSCYILESQQTILLAREPVPSLIQETGFDLPFPGHSSAWGATNPDEWALAVHRDSHLPAYVYEVTPESMAAPFDSFQSSVLLTAHYNHFDSATSYASSSSVLEIEHLLDTSPVTSRKLLTAKLVQVTPIRALLSVSGESWILSEKTSPQSFATLKTTLRAWVTQLWSPAGAEPVPVKEALELSIKLVHQALEEQRDSVKLEMGTDMGIYFAALVLWAITTAANTRLKGPQQKAQQQPYRRQSQSPLMFDSDTITAVLSTSNQLTDHFSHHPSVAPSHIQATTAGPIHNQPMSPIAQASLETTTLLSHAQITINTISFLSTALLDLGSAASMSQLPLNIARCQTGCISLLLWVKLRLRGVSLDDRGGVADPWASKPGEGLGELLDGVTGSIERMLSRGWNGWGI